MAGKVQEKAGEVMNDEEMEAKGKAKRLEGKVQGVGDMKDKVGDVKDRITD